MSKISVLIPTYNSVDSLDLLIRSLVDGADDINNVEIIVGIDGTEQVNKPIVDKWKSRVNFLISPTNQGLCRNTNLLVYNASNEWVLILNDDNVAPKGYDTKLGVFTNQTNCVITPNQMEPTPSMFSQFSINNLGRDPKTFDLEKFWEAAEEASHNTVSFTGSTLPIFVRKLDFIKIGGWDENYPPNGIVADWDYFLKCNLSGMEMIRTYNCHFYHFVSLSVNNTEENNNKRQRDEQSAHMYAKYKWGDFIKHNPENNLKYI
jgi:glycosyltransferase involved in cell wall biosynthesis